ncbi:hypothetical protein CapIbe_002362 [Capra ibex]
MEHNQKAGKPEPKAGLAIVSAPHLCPSIGINILHYHDIQGKLAPLPVTKVRYRTSSGSRVLGIHGGIRTALGCLLSQTAWSRKEVLTRIRSCICYCLTVVPQEHISIF